VINDRKVNVQRSSRHLVRESLVSLCCES
jgi:hypothetical protein